MDWDLIDKIKKEQAQLWRTTMKLTSPDPDRIVIEKRELSDLPAFVMVYAGQHEILNAWRLRIKAPKDSPYSLVGLAWCDFELFVVPASSELVELLLCPMFANASFPDVNVSDDPNLRVALHLSQEYELRDADGFARILQHLPSLLLQPNTSHADSCTPLYLGEDPWLADEFKARPKEFTVRDAYAKPNLVDYTRAVLATLPAVTPYQNDFDRCVRTLMVYRLAKTEQQLLATVDKAEDLMLEVDTIVPTQSGLTSDLVEALRSKRFCSFWPAEYIEHKAKLIPSTASAELPSLSVLTECEEQARAVTEKIDKQSDERFQAGLLFLAMPPETKDPLRVTIAVKSPGGGARTQYKSFAKTTTVRQLKLYMDVTEGAPTESQIMVFNGKQLKDSQTLEEIGIKYDNSIAMVFSSDRYRNRLCPLPTRAERLYYEAGLLGNSPSSAHPGGAWLDLSAFRMSRDLWSIIVDYVVCFTRDV